MAKLLTEINLWKKNSKSGIGSVFPLGKKNIGAIYQQGNKKYMYEYKPTGGITQQQALRNLKYAHTTGKPGSAGKLATKYFGSNKNPSDLFEIVNKTTWSIGGTNMRTKAKNPSSKTEVAKKNQAAFEKGDVSKFTPKRYQQLGAGKKLLTKQKLFMADPSTLKGSAKKEAVKTKTTMKYVQVGASLVENIADSLLAAFKMGRSLR